MAYLKHISLFHSALSRSNQYLSVFKFFFVSSLFVVAVRSRKVKNLTGLRSSHSLLFFGKSHRTGYTTCWHLGIHCNGVLSNRDARGHDVINAHSASTSFGCVVVCTHFAICAWRSACLPLLPSFRTVETSALPAPLYLPTASGHSFHSFASIVNTLGLSKSSHISEWQGSVLWPQHDLHSCWLLLQLWTTVEPPTCCVFVLWMILRCYTECSLKCPHIGTIQLFRAELPAPVSLSWWVLLISRARGRLEWDEHAVKSMVGCMITCMMCRNCCGDTCWEAGTQHTDMRQGCKSCFPTTCLQMTHRIQNTKKEHSCHRAWSRFRFMRSPVPWNQVPTKLGCEQATKYLDMHRHELRWLRVSLINRNVIGCSR